MNEVLQQVSAMGIVPVIKITDVEKAVPLARALCAGGLPCAEITFRTEQAEEAIQRITREVPQMLVGAGTVLTREQVDVACAAGARFIVTPGFNEKVVQYCLNKGMPVTPGCVTPSDIERAIEMGLDIVKFFPAEASGGIAMIKALAGPYPQMRFMPTGGISAKNINEYLAFPKVVACGGSWMVKEELIDSGAFDQITVLTREAVEAMLGFQVAHVGINAGDDAQAGETAKQLCALFGFAYDSRPTVPSVFAGSGIEVMAGAGRGAHGHIAISTNFIERAAAYLSARGYALDMAHASRDDKGRLKVVYLCDDIAGFAVHLLQR